MNYILFDIEATCWHKDDIQLDNESIEIGAVKLDNDLNLLDEFKTFIKPLNHPELSSFCKNLTNITQEDIDSAPLFDKSIELFYKWIGEEAYTLASWGYFDLNVLTHDSSNYKLETKKLNCYINLRNQYHKIKRIKGRIGFEKVLKSEELSFNGKAHRALVDAQNLVELFRKFKHSWHFDGYAKNKMNFNNKKNK